MAVISESWILELAMVLGSAIFGLYLFFQYKYRHWGKLGIPHTDPTFPLGDFGEAGRTKHFVEVFKELYERYDKERYFGMWLLCQPILIVRDPDIIKDVMVKEFMSFHDRGAYLNERDEPLSAHLFSLEGAKWRTLRAKMSPTFTSGKMKMMFPRLVECGDELVPAVDRAKSATNVVEVKEIAARFSTDVISSCAFGIQTNSLKNPDSEFRKMGKKLLEPTIDNLTRQMLAMLAPKFVALMRMRILSKTVSVFFMNAVKETIDYREQNNVKRNDFLQLMINLKNKGTVEDVDQVKNNDEKIESHPFSFNEAAAQSFIFFIAGFETSSTTMQFALYELAKNQDIQDKVRDEIQKGLAKTDGKMTYEGVFEMEYLGKVIDETLRLYPPAGAIMRKCNKDYKIPNSDHVITAGTTIQISLDGMHRDPKYYPDPDRFDPERFSEEEKAKRNHYVYMPFGEGPRNCIGMRFGLMQTRVGLITLLSNYKFEVCKKTPIPLILDPKSMMATPKGGMNLKVTKL